MPELKMEETHTFVLIEWEKRARKRSERGLLLIHLSNHKEMKEPFPILTLDMERKEFEPATISFQMGVLRV
jgi:hypothetical protein